MLTSHLGNPERKVLTPAQLRSLAARMGSMERPADNRDLQEEDLIALGYGKEQAQRILTLLSEEDVLCWYLSRAAMKNCVPVTRVSSHYPALLRQRLGTDCPGCLWAKGDLSLLEKPAIALVGSRELNRENYIFAREVGKQAALQGYVLVSGNARGADRTAQDACLACGGQVICVVADQLEEQSRHPNVLYLSEDCFDGAFSAQRALSRNRVIHCLADRVFVAQATLGKGGTWDGVTKNLRHSWSDVFCFADGSQAVCELIQMGAQPINAEDLKSINSLLGINANFF